MDDLSGLNWSSAASAKPAVPQATTSSTTTARATASFPVLRPTPPPPLASSGRNTPLSTLGSGLGSGSAINSNSINKPVARPPPAAHDSFSSLANFGRGGPSTSSANLTLREQQERLEAERRRKEEEKRQQARANYGDGQFWDALAGQGQGQGLRPGAKMAGSAPVSRTVSPGVQLGSGSGMGAGPALGDDDDDLFAAFNASTKVDNASYYPPPPASSGKASPAPQGLDLTNPSAWAGVSGSKAIIDGGGLFGDDNDQHDPLGLDQLGAKPAMSARPAVIGGDYDDDLLGDLAKPVDQLKKRQPKPEPERPKFAREPIPGKPIEDSSSDSDDAGQEPAPSDDPFDRAVAQLVDYGFPAEDARRALTESGSGLNVQAAVNWLLDEAHRKSKEQAKQRNGGGGTVEARARSRERSSGVSSRNGNPAWMQAGMADADRRRDMSPSNLSDGGDFAKTAAAMGNQFLKTAGSIWKTGQKKVQQAVAEFQQEGGGDPSQPKWMRSSQQDRSDEGPGERRRRAVAAAAAATDEAMMLEGGVGPGGRPKLGHGSASNLSSRDVSPARSEIPQGRTQPTAPKWQQASQPGLRDPRSRLNKLAVEEEGAHYVSPARRRKAPSPQPEVQAKTQPPVPEADLLFDPSAISASRSKATSPFAQAQQPAPPRPPPKATPSPRLPPSPRPARPRRDIPAVSVIALQSSTKHRLEGTAHFKRGDYAAAHASYTSSLSAIPQTHPLAILLLCNRALTSLKTGEPRQAMVDADAAIGLIGPAGGEGEQVELVIGGSSTSTSSNGNGTAGPDARDIGMRELYGKALSRKAEALEQMEKWADAGSVWHTCVEARLGGATATAGRQRCQKALAPKPAARPRPAAAPRVVKKPAAAGVGVSAGASATAQSSEAVARLRAANQAAEREGQEKFEASDKVDARVAAWRDGKRENLRALLGSLDRVLWDGSGWKNVGMHELVMPNKVKIVYMRAIAKTHPDKIAQDASTEARMVAGFVFSTLNEAWDKFKAENGL